MAHLSGSYREYSTAPKVASASLGKAGSNCVMFVATSTGYGSGLPLDRSAEGIRPPDATFIIVGLKTSRGLCRSPTACSPPPFFPRRTVARSRCRYFDNYSDDRRARICRLVQLVPVKAMNDKRLNSRPYIVCPSGRLRLLAAISMPARTFINTEPWGGLANSADERTTRPRILLTRLVLKLSNPPLPLRPRVGAIQIVCVFVDVESRMIGGVFKAK